jgi:hypothetical protein
MHAIPHKSYHLGHIYNISYDGGSEEAIPIHPLFIFRCKVEKIDVSR